MSAWVSAVALSVSVAVSSAPVLPEKEPDAESVLQTEATDVESEAPSLAETANTDANPEAPAGPEDVMYVEAYDRYLEAQGLFDLGLYLDAGAMFRRSYAAVPMGRTLYAVGLSYEKGGEVIPALEAYRRYLGLPDCPAPEDRCAANRSEVQGIVAKLRARVGELSIEVDDGVELLGIEIGDRMVPPEDFPIIVPPGHYVLRERGYGKGDVRIREIDIDAGQVFSLLVVDFDAPTTPPPEQVTDPGPPSSPSNRISDEERRRRLRIAFYGGVGVTAAAGIATGVVGGLTLSAHNTYAGRCTGTCGPGDGYPEDAEQRFDRLKPVTNALVGVTAGLGITTVVVGLFAFSGKRGRDSRASVTRVTPTPGGVRVRF